MTSTTAADATPSQFEPVKSSAIVNLIAVLIFFSGLANLWHVLFRGAAIPYVTAHATRPVMLLAGVTLMLLAANLLRRRLLAFWLAVAFLCVTEIIHVLHYGLDITAGFLAGALMLLAVQYKQFRVRSSKESVIQGLGLVAVIVVITAAYGVLGFYYLDPREFNMDFQLVDSVERAFREFFFLGNPDLPKGTAEGRWFLESLRWLGGISAAVMLASLFQPLRYKLAVEPKQQAQATDIAKANSVSSLDYFKLMPDKSLFFSSTGKSFISYTTELNTALALGDPVGPPEDLDTVISEYCRFCWRSGWLAAFFRAEPSFIERYERQGLHLLKIGEEAVVDLNKFVSQAGINKDFRRRRRKFEEDGFRCVRALPPHDDKLIDDIEEVSRDWLSLPGRHEQKFTLGRFSREYMGISPLFYLQDKNKQIIAFVNEVPSYATGEATIDLMRHRTQMPNGAMDFLFMQLFEQLHKEGYKAFNLGLAPLSGVGDELGASMPEQIVHQLYENMNHVFSYKGLRQYKQKFEPLWQDRFLVYQGGATVLLHTAAAVIKATK